MRHNNWPRPKCQHNDYDAGQVRASGGFWSRIFDVQNRKYTAVTCEKCSYTEFYKSSSSTVGNTFDFVAN